MNILSCTVPTGGLHIVANCERIRNADMNGRLTHILLRASHIDRDSFLIDHEKIEP